MYSIQLSGKNIYIKLSCRDILREPADIRGSIISEFGHHFVIVDQKVGVDRLSIRLDLLFSKIVMIDGFEAIVKLINQWGSCRNVQVYYFIV